MFIWFPDKTLGLSDCPYNTHLPDIHKSFPGNDLSELPFLFGVLSGFQITLQVSRCSKGVYRTSNTLAFAVQNIDLDHFVILNSIPVSVSQIASTPKNLHSWLQTSGYGRNSESMITSESKMSTVVTTYFA